ncbi:hypothetical protein [Streptomyces sp. NPDC058280]|uniref:hypothetical protein n=1 Tax=Streptomyces sp. NPDC058280 TaxID=3346419 RepID=UPI0036EF6BF8
MTAARVRTALYALSSLVLGAMACVVGRAGGTWWSVALFTCAALAADAVGLAHDTGLRLRARPVRSVPGTAREDRLTLALDVARAENRALRDELDRRYRADDAADSIRYVVDGLALRRPGPYGQCPVSRPTTTDTTENGT